MIDRKIRMVVMTTLLFGILQAAMAGAVELRFEPQDQNIAVDDAGRLAIWLDEALNVRTIEIRVSFNGDILTGLEGGMGAAFQELPCFVWDEYEPEENQWYGFAVSMGAECFVVGPGELYSWDFVGSASGTSFITAATIGLYDNLGEEILEVSLPGTTVVVGDGVAPAADLSGPLSPTILASPNPCNPMTHIRFWLPGPRSANLAVYDLRGRRVRQLLDGQVQGEWTSVRWDGRDDNGSAAPSGVYLYRLETNRENLAGRVTLAR